MGKHGNGVAAHKQMSNAGKPQKGRLAGRMKEEEVYTTSSRSSSRSGTRSAKKLQAGSRNGSETRSIEHHGGEDDDDEDENDDDDDEDASCQKDADADVNADMNSWTLGQRPSGGLQFYPRAIASHSEVIRDPQLFASTLRDFLIAIGVALREPIIGRSKIDLHAFYREVTAHGGLQQVIRSGCWENLCDALNVPRSLINRQYILRKHYINLLFHYEQVYFFGAEGKLLPPPGPLPAPIALEKPQKPRSLSEAPPGVSSSLKKTKEERDPVEVFGVGPAACIGTICTGAINGKFNEGYFVTVAIGSEKLSGLLYHFSPYEKAEQFATVTSMLDGLGVREPLIGSEIQPQRKRRKDYGIKKNLIGPKRARTGYNIFIKEQRARLKELYPGTKGLGKRATEMWNKLPENEKSYYHALGNVEKERHLAEYREKWRLQQSQVSDQADGSSGGSAPAYVAESCNGAYHVSHDYHVSADAENRVPTTNTHLSGVADQQIYDGYRGHEPQCYGNSIYEPQDDDSHRSQKPGFEELDEEEVEENNETEESYEAEDDDTIYRSADKILEEQDANEEPDYHVTHEDSDHEKATNEVTTQKPNLHDESLFAKRAFCGEDLKYPYQFQNGPAHSNTTVQQSPYPVPDTSRVMFPQNGQADISSVEHGLSQFSYGYMHPVAPLHVQNQYMVPSIQTWPEQQAYRPEMYSYPTRITHGQMYAQPSPQFQAYRPCFPHSSYPVLWNGTQALMQGHNGYAPRIYQPSVVAPELRPSLYLHQAQQDGSGGHIFGA